MVEQPDKSPVAQEPDTQEGVQSVPWKQRIDKRLSSILTWIAASRLRVGIAGTMGLAMIASLFFAWSYLAHLAVDAPPEVTIEMALEALDQHDTDKARVLVGKLQQQADGTSYFGGALFVLGASKEYDADLELSTDRRRAIHLVAARYLQKAQSIGLPPDREEQFTYLLGRSLVLGSQPRDGIVHLEKALLQEGQPKFEILTLLVKAYLELPNPGLEDALKHNQTLLSLKLLSPENQSRALLVQADILVRLKRIEAAKKVLASVNDQEDLPRKKLILGQLLELEAALLPQDSPNRAEQIARALTELRAAQKLASANGTISRNALYWIGKCYDLQGEAEAAIEQFDQIIHLYGDTPEGLAATLAKANKDLNANNVDRALVGYRTVLGTVGDPVLYSNHLLPLKTIRKVFTAAYHYLLDHECYDQALTLVDQFEPLFSKVDTKVMLANIHRQWGEKKLKEAASSKYWQIAEPTREGRYHYRAAATAYEEVAKLRFATNNYTDDLWRAAEYYFSGHSFTHAVRLYNEYLHHEATRRNGQALLRLGQSHLALNHTTEAINILTDCIDLYPESGVIYQARIDCARACIEEDQHNRAESLLQVNLTGDTLNPKSMQWRDSLFMLGTLLHDTERYIEAIHVLEEAIIRYPNAPHALLSRYLIARSFHNASEIPKKNLQTAKTETERQKNRTFLEDYLAQSLENYQLVQEALTGGQHKLNDELGRSLLRNCYVMQGSVLFQLKRYDEARKAYANISTLYQHEPFVLESFVQIAYCWQRLNQPIKSRQTIEQAKLVLNRLPEQTNFKLATNFNRQEWHLFLDEMGRW
jgi:TolA-binding protein